MRRGNGIKKILGHAGPVLGMIRGHKSSCELREQNQGGGGERANSRSSADFKSKDNKKGSKAGTGNKIGYLPLEHPKLCPVHKNMGSASESTSESQAWSLRKQKGRRGWGKTAQAEADTDGSGGEEHGLIPYFSCFV